MPQKIHHVGPALAIVNVPLNSEKNRDNERITHPIEKWCYFLLKAEVSTPGEIASRLQDPVFSEATEFREMIARDPEERSLYQDRLKMERDVRAKIDYAIEEARKVAIQEGRQEERIRTVKMLRDILGAGGPSDEEVAGLSFDELAATESDFQRRLRERR